MAHELDFTKGSAAFAYVGDEAWHGYGNKLADDADMPTWLKAAGMDYNLKQSPVMFYDADNRAMDVYTGKKIIFRDDVNAPLSIVSDRYQVVQPAEVLGFFTDLTKAAGFTLETAGVLKQGRKYWALARTNNSAAIDNCPDDELKQYMLLSSSCDGSLATRAEFTSIRVVCNNTLSAAIMLAGQSADTRLDFDGNVIQNRISVTHSKKVDFDKIKAQLGIYATSWDKFMERANDLSKRRVSNEVTKSFLVSLFGKKDVPAAEQTEQDTRAMRQVYALFEGTGKGSQLDSACGTAWGLVNAVTEYVDHHTTVTDPLDSAWFGAGAVLKQRAVALADELTANI